jgi:ParB family transcriptional regulator, chromosome partitioning protein
MGEALMARKNLLTALTEKKLPDAGPNAGVGAKPAAPFSGSLYGRGAFGAVTRTIDDLAARADAARSLEARLTAGAIVVDLDPTTIDRSPIIDRMELEDENYIVLRDSIADKGQESPILVRPHPTISGRYQVAFGHRRLRAAADLGKPARCIIKPLTDRELVIAQGQENSARANLSFIERGRFAQALEEGGYDRETIMQALSIDKTTLSRIISVANRLPTDIVEAIGPAPAVGRDRWTELAAVFSERVVARPVDPLLESTEFRTAASDERFEMLYQHLARPDPKPQPEGKKAPASGRRPKERSTKPIPWLARSGETVATVTVSEQAFVLTIDKTVAKEFGEFLMSRMGPLYEEYVVGPVKTAPVRHSLQR